MFKFIPDKFKNEDMCEQAVKKDVGRFNLYQIASRNKKCENLLLKKMLGCLSMYQISLRPKRCILILSEEVFFFVTLTLYQIIFLTQVCEFAVKRNA